MKKPIILIDEFISPLRCTLPNVLDFVDQKVPQIISYIETYYNVTIIENTKPEILTDLRIRCDNSILKGKWIKIKNYDFSCYIPLVSYNNKPPFDPETDVYGGTLFFTNFKFSLAPNVGRLLIYPSVPNFTHIHEPVKIGALKYIKIFFTCDKPFVYDLSKWNNVL